MPSFHVVLSERKQKRADDDEKPRSAHSGNYHNGVKQFFSSEQFDLQTLCGATVVLYQSPPQEAPKGPKGKVVNNFKTYVILYELQGLFPASQLAGYASSTRLSSTTI